MAHYIIVANGEFLVREILEEAVHGKIIIALDGAANKLARIGIKPQVIIGDFDSVQSSNVWGIKKTFSDLQDNDEPYEGNFGIQIVPARDQNLNDLTKAIRYCDKLGAESIAIICAAGGRLDHHESNLRSLRAEYKINRPILFHTEQQSLRYATNQELEYVGEPGDKCGIMAYPHGSFSSVGLEYDVTDYELNFGFTESSSNALKLPVAQIRIKGEVLLIMPPLLNAQRAYSKKSEVEQLDMRWRDANQTIQDKLSFFSRGAPGKNSPDNLKHPDTTPDNSSSP